MDPVKIDLHRVKFSQMAVFTCMLLAGINFWWDNIVI